MLPCLKYLVDDACITHQCCSTLFGRSRAYSRRSGSSWSRVNTLTPPGGDSDFFGHGVSLGADGVLAVGAPSYYVDGNKGAVYVYQQNPQTSTDFDLVETLVDDSGIDNYFGSAVAVSGTMLLVGAPKYKNPSGDSVGVVSHFKHSGASWVQIGLLFAQGVATSGHLECFMADPVSASPKIVLKFPGCPSQVDCRLMSLAAQSSSSQAAFTPASQSEPGSAKLMGCLESGQSTHSQCLEMSSLPLQRSKIHRL